MVHYRFFKIKDELFKVISYDNEEVYRTLKAMKVDKIAKPLNIQVDDEDVIIVLSDSVFELLDDYYNNRIKELSVIKIKNNNILLYKKSPESILNRYNLSQATPNKNNVLLITMFNVQEIIEHDAAFKCKKCEQWFKKHNNSVQFSRIGVDVLCKKCYNKPKNKKDIK
jgi:hypothetical protein